MGLLGPKTATAHGWSHEVCMQCAIPGLLGSVAQLVGTPWPCTTHSSLSAVQIWQTELPSHGVSPDGEQILPQNNGLDHAGSLQKLNVHVAMPISTAEHFVAIASKKKATKSGATEE